MNHGTILFTRLLNKPTNILPCRLQDNLHSGILCCELKSINGRMERVMEKFLGTTRLSIIKIQSGSERYSQGYLGSGL